MKKFICLFLTAILLTFAGCQRNDPNKTYQTDEIIKIIEKDKKKIQSEEDKSDLLFAVKAIPNSKGDVTSLSSKLSCFEGADGNMNLSEKISVQPAVNNSEDGAYTEVKVVYDTSTSYIYHCKDKNWTIEIAE